MFTLEMFVRESNRIEGILRDPTEDEMRAHRLVLTSPILSVPLFERFVSMVQPGALLRRHEGMNVVVGNYHPPSGGPNIETELSGLLALREHPLVRHVAYEQLHPFIDGNGRSGRVLWLWEMAQRFTQDGKAEDAKGNLQAAPLGFLHHFYYQTLERAEQRR